VNRNKQRLLSSLVLVPFCLAILGFSSTVFSETRYVSDRIYVPLRSGKGDQYRIVHKGLPSGTEIKLLETDDEAGYSLVETDKGVQGWMRSQYLLNSPTAAIRLQSAEAKLVKYSSNEESLANINIGLTEELDTLKAAHGTLSGDHETLQKQFNELKDLSTNTIKINEKNKELLEKNQILQSKVDGLEATKDKLSDNQSIRMFVFGGLLVLATLLLNTVLDGVKRRRSFSNW